MDAVKATTVDQGRVLKVRTACFPIRSCCHFPSQLPALVFLPIDSNFINVTSMHVDCDGDSLIYLGVPDGPSCHTVRSLVDRMRQESL